MARLEEGGNSKMTPTGETYFSWRGLDFKQSDGHGNFMPKTMFWNHEKELVRYPIAELAEQYDHQRLLASLEKGNKANVTIIRDDKEIKATVAANPRTMSFDFYDASGRAMSVKPVEKQKVGRSEKLEQGSQGHSQATDKKESTKTDLAAGEKSNKAERKRRGLHI